MVRQSIPPRTLRKTHWKSQCEWGHPCNSRYIFIPFCLSLLELKRSLLTEKFSSWAEETSIWLRNNTVTQSNFWLSTLILSNFNFFFWKIDSRREEKIIAVQWLKLKGFRCHRGGKHIHHQMEMWAGMGGLLGLIRKQDNLSPPFHKKKKKSKYLYYSFITCIFNEKDKISYHLL